MKITNQKDAEKFVKLVQDLSVLADLPHLLHNQFRSPAEEISEKIGPLFNTTHTPPAYDPNTGILVIRNKKINIKLNTDQSELCKVIFQSHNSLKKVWNYDELAKKWGENPIDIKWRRFYQAGREINKKIAMKASFNDFFICKKTSVSINTLYLT